jgi:transposase
MPVSDDTILRQLKLDAAVAHYNSTVRVVGTDDWSWRRSWRYGTMIVDLERRSVVDILEDRSVARAAQWLERHPSVEIVSRDQCGLYAQAVREGAPQARQVADRFHLTQNLRVAIEEQMSLSGRATGRALLPSRASPALSLILISPTQRIGAGLSRGKACFSAKSWTRHSY